MSEEDLALLKAHFEKMQKELDTPEKARNYLIKYGFLNHKGGLSEMYYSADQIAADKLVRPENY